MKRFKWNGIPVNLPDTKGEWIAVGLLFGIEAIVIIVVIIVLISNR